MVSSSRWREHSSTMSAWVAGSVCTSTVTATIRRPGAASCHSCGNGERVPSKSRSASPVATARYATNSPWISTSTATPTRSPWARSAAASRWVGIPSSLKAR